MSDSNGVKPSNEELEELIKLCDRPSGASHWLHIAYLARAELQRRQQLASVPVYINPTHEAADAFWEYWRKTGEVHKHGYYESTWGAINAALLVAGIHRAAVEAASVPAELVEQWIKDSHSKCAGETMEESANKFAHYIAGRAWTAAYGRGRSYDDLCVVCKKPRSECSARKPEPPTC